MQNPEVKMPKYSLALFLIFIIPVLHPQACFAYDTSAAKYMPLRVGNVWVYIENYGYPYSQCFNYHKYTLTGTTNINGKIYYNISVTTSWSNVMCQQGGGPPNIFSRLFSTFKIRLDSLNGNIYTGESCGTNKYIPCDSLAARLGDTSNFCTGSNPPYRETCTDTNTVNIFGVERKTKSFSYPHPGGAEGQSYAQGIGMYYAGWAESSVWWTETLRGCVINGVLYGDTNTIVAVQNISSEIPTQFSLSQNYPNPFNPSTVIRFQVASDRFVKITVYDVQGKEVSVLVNEQLKPGTYETNWDAANFPSGVYYYQLTVNSEQLTKYAETKKMVLIK